MWKEKLLTSLSSLSRLQIFSISLFLLGFILLSGGLIYSINSNKASEDNQGIIFETESSSSPKSENKITIDVEGAVLSPGVYSLSSSSRTKDALIAAGGLSNNADRDWVSKNLNLARKLVDSDKLYIPRIGENVASPSNIQTTLININSASLSELDSLPGIGAVTAQKIIDNRPYSSINDLTAKKIVKSSVFQNIKDKIIF